MKEWLEIGLKVAGVAQLILVVMSFAIPKCLGMQKRVAVLDNFMRQMFWTYATYVLGSHLFFGIISLLYTEALLNGGVGNAMLFFMGAWWTGRICCQFFFFDRTGIPKNRFNNLAEGVLVAMFFGLVVVYWGAWWWTL